MFCFLSDTKPLIQTIISTKNREIEKNQDFLYEISNFNNHFKLSKESMKFNHIWSIIIPCISGYLIQKSYLKDTIPRIEQFIHKIDKPSTQDISDEEYIELRVLGSGSTFTCSLNYLISEGKLFVIKRANGCSLNEKEKLIKRELLNYSMISHPFIPEFYGRIKDKEGHRIEYINGPTLKNIKSIKFTASEIFNIIFELMLIIKYFHDNELIYRDLKPDNVMIDSRKTVVLIDFDRLITYNKSEEQTLDLGGNFVDPEIIDDGFSYASDIYSLGLLIKYLMNKPNIKEMMPADDYLQIDKIILKCINKTVQNRPSISELIHEFISAFQSKTQIENLLAKYEEHFNNFEILNKITKNYRLNKDNPEILTDLGDFYCKGNYVAHDINKAIRYYLQAADLNYPKAQYNLGDVYYFGKYIKQDITKAINYFILAAHQNNLYAQYNLGNIYYSGKYIRQDIEKAIYYFTLAANQNDPDAQYNLGIIYYSGNYIRQDIEKSIHYFTLAANSNVAEAQYNLGFIYDEGAYVMRDINKAILYYSMAADQGDPRATLNLGLLYHDRKYSTFDIKKSIKYLKLAANQNNPRAQFNLGIIYYEGRDVILDINEAIHYFNLAANQNHIKAQFYLGVIYCSDRYNSLNINKAVHFFTLAANQEDPQAQYNLGVIYFNGKHVARDIHKAIHYFSLAANQNHLEAQANIGRLYYEGKYVTRDINKAIHYLTKASNQNDPKSQFLLGIIYYLGDCFLSDIKKGRYYIMLASLNGDKDANFAHGFLLHEGKNINKDIDAAIHYYKEASSFNNPYAKNNLGIIYKHGYSKIKSQIGRSISYFEEAIYQQNDALSMYNLAHIYIYNETINADINKTIDLLIRSSDQFLYSLILLALLLIKQHGFNLEIINETIKKHTTNNAINIGNTINDFNLFDKRKFDNFYELHRNIDFVYDIQLNPVQASDLQKTNFNKEMIKYPNSKDITFLFYEGLGN